MLPIGTFGMPLNSAHALYKLRQIAEFFYFNFTYSQFLWDGPFIPVAPHVVSLKSEIVCDCAAANWGGQGAGWEVG